jgi:hypothetical protein
MASEITLAGLLRFSKGGSADELGLNALADMSGAEFTRFRQAVGTSEEALNLPADISSPYWVFLINRDATNFIKFRFATGTTEYIKVLPNKFAGPFLLSAAAPYVQADTGACQLEFLLVEA